MMEVNQKKSFDSFIKKEYKKLLNYVRKNLEERFFDSSPEDIVQDVTLNLLSKIDVDSQIDNIAGYMYRSLKNKIIDEKRKTRNKILLEHFDSNHMVSAEIKSLADDFTIERLDVPDIDYKSLYEAISQLKPDEQALLISTEFENKTFTELSEKWNVPIGTLLSRKHRALSKLYKILTKKENKQFKINEYGNERKLPGKKTLAL
jgi:RNA polymerase sigma factor (sigma-70 family)